MMNYIRDLRLIPIAVIACACLLALKAADLLLDGGSLIAGDDAPKIESTAVVRTTADVPRPSSSMLSWASQMFNFPDGSGATTAPVVASLPADRTNLDITGSVPAETADKDKQAKADPAKPPETGEAARNQAAGHGHSNRAGPALRRRARHPRAAARAPPGARYAREGTRHP